MHRVTVLPAYSAVAQYIDAARAEPGADRARLYREHVTAPVWEQLVAGAEYEHIAPYAFALPTRTVSALADAAAELGRLAVEARIGSSIQQAATLLPSRATTVCVLPLDPNDTVARDQMHGVIGYCLGAGRIVIHISPAARDWAAWLAYTLTHEYHHSAWTERYYQPFDLAARLVFEGRADAFARLHYPHLAAPWTVALTPEQARHYWHAMHDALASTDPAVFDHWVFGGRDGVPKWTGYAVGFGIVQAFLERHPEVTVEEWTALDPHALIAASGYGD